MTKEDKERDIGRAYMERRDLQEKVDCLRLRLRTVGEACKVLADNAVHAESVETMLTATDPREDWQELQKAYTRLDELAILLT